MRINSFIELYNKCNSVIEVGFLGTETKACPTQIDRDRHTDNMKFTPNNCLRSGSLNLNGIFDTWSLLGDSPGFDCAAVATDGCPATSVPGCWACEVGGVSP